MIDIGLFNLMAIWLYIYMAYRTSKHTYYVYIYVCIFIYIDICHSVTVSIPLIFSRAARAVRTEVVEMDLLHDLVILGATVEPEETSHGNVVLRWMGQLNPFITR
jgi:hypothetical protein